MISDEILDGILEWPTIADAQRLVGELRRHRLEIARLRGALAAVHDNVDRGPEWVRVRTQTALDHPPESLDVTR